MSDPFVGTWTLNPTRSAFDRNHRPRQATMTWRLDADGGYLLLAEGVDAKGERCTEKPQRLRPDGVAYPVEGLHGFMSSHRLVVPKSTTLEDGQFVLRGSQLTGSNILTPSFETRLADPVAAGIRNERDVYLTDAKMFSFQSMAPWIVFALCPECRHERLLLTDGGHRYIDVLVGHRVVLSA